MDVTRQNYLDGEISYRDYYGHMVGLVSLDKLVPLLPLKTQLREAFETDENFNNIPLYMWDGRHYEVLQLARESGCTKLEGNSWSLSNSVCLLKEAARQFVKRNSI